MERLVHATRSKGIKPATNLSLPGSKVPAAIKKLQSGEDWNFKASGCRLPSISWNDSAQAVVAPAVNTNEESESEDEIESYSRFIGETVAIRNLFQESSVCASCKRGKLLVSYETKCLATTVHTRCEKCLAHCASTTTSTSIPQASQDRNTNYASNVLFVLAQILLGNGGTETSRILSMLDLPNSVSIADTAFPSIEYDLGQFIIPYAKEVIRNNLIREVEMYAQSHPDFDLDLWKRDHSIKPELVAIKNLPLLTVGYDMGWQKRSSGH
jgi:hypothetical protein